MAMIKDTLFAKYIKERGNYEILENESGFITYKCIEKECIIKDMCVDQAMRAKGHGASLISEIVEIAKQANCSFLSANIYLEDKGATNTLLAALRVGFKLIRAEAGVLLIVKDIGGNNG